MKRIIFILCFSLVALGNDAHIAESKTQSDLEAVLSQLMPRDQFLVQVLARLETKRERELIEGEYLVPAPTPKIEEPKLAKAEPPPMPGFTPDLDEISRNIASVEPPQPAPLRQRYRMVDRIELKKLRVHVTFHDEIPKGLESQAKNLVRGYMRRAYPEVGSLAFSVISMLGPRLKKQEEMEQKRRDLASIEKEKVLAEKNRPEPKAPLSLEERLLQYAPWILMAFLLSLTVIIWQMLRVFGRRGKTAKTRERQNSAASGFAPPPYYPGQFAVPSPFQTTQQAGEPQSKPGPANTSAHRDLLEKFIENAQAFKLFFNRLTDDERSTISQLVAGPAFDNMMEGLEMQIPLSTGPLPAEPDKAARACLENFKDFLLSNNWKREQMFGFLEYLSDEQLVALLSHEPPMASAIMMRFLKAEKSALVLERLPAAKRLEILAQVPNLEYTSLQEIAQIEQQVRNSVRGVPNHMFGSHKSDIEYWGTVLSEAEDQDTIFQDLEQTNPGIISSLAKYKFRLEDAPSLPDDAIAVVFGKVDNEQLGLALSSCSDDVIEVLLDAIPERRRNYIRSQLTAYKGASPKQIANARHKLTKQFQELMQ